MTKVFDSNSLWAKCQHTQYSTLTLRQFTADKNTIHCKNKQHGNLLQETLFCPDRHSAQHYDFLMLQILHVFSYPMSIMCAYMYKCTGIHMVLLHSDHLETFSSIYSR